MFIDKQVAITLHVETKAAVFGNLLEHVVAALHISVKGSNAHHMVEACFKAVGRALRQAIRLEGGELPSTKGVLN